MTLLERYRWLLESIHMPPWELDRYIKGFTEDDRQHFKQIAGDTIATKWSSVHHYLEEHLQLLREASDLGSFPNKSEQLKFLIRAFPVASVSAKVSKHTEGVLILINDGLVTFCAVYLSIVLRSRQFQQKTFVESCGAIVYEHDEEIELTASLFHEYLFFENLDAKRSPGLFKNLIKKGEEGLWNMYVNLQNEMISFVIAHELAHIRYGHLNNNLNKEIQAANGSIEVVDFGWPDEIEADTYASVLLFNPQRKRTDGGKKLSEYADHFLMTHILSGIILFFNIARSIEFYSDQIHQLFGILLPLSSTHPPAKERLEFILTALMDRKVIPKDPRGMGVGNNLIDHHYFNEKEIWERIRDKISINNNPS